MARILEPEAWAELHDQDVPEFSCEWEELRRESLRLARAAITAMREPTDRMIASGRDKPVWHAWGPDGEFIENPETVWGTMIDAALGEKP